MEKRKKCILGIDLGTTNIKGILLAEDGAIVASASASCTNISPGPGLFEQDAQQWWDSCVLIIRQLISAMPAVDGIEAISISSQVISLLPVNNDGHPLRNAIMYQDCRSANELDYIVNTIGLDNFIETTGGRPSMAFLPNKLLWFKNNESELFEQTHCILQANGFLNFMLTGEFTQDIDCATRTQCYNISDLRPATNIEKATGIDFSHILPPPVPCKSIIGTVTKEAALATGLTEGIPVIAGCSDAMASMYATGISQLGEAGESSGTTSLLFAGSPIPSPTNAPITTRPCYINGIPYVFDAPISASGASISWYISTTGRYDIYDAQKKGLNIYDYLNDMGLKVPPGSNGLLFFPYLIGGERAPLWNSYARGMYIGLKADTTHEHMLRAVYEGTSFAIKHVLEIEKQYGAEVSSLRVTGGGAGSSLWNTIKASMLHVPVYVIDKDCGDVPFGDCILAGTALGIFDDINTASKSMIKIKEIVEPVPEWEDAYDMMFPFYVNAYKQLDSLLQDFKHTTDNL